MIQHRIRYVIEIVVGRITKEQRLHERWYEQAHTGARILQDCQKFLACQCKNAKNGVEHRYLSPVFCASRCGYSTPALSPWRRAPAYLVQSPTRHLRQGTPSAATQHNNELAAHMLSSAPLLACCASQT